MPEMKRGRSQVIWRYSPGYTFRYNENKAWCVVKNVTLKNQEELGGALQEALTRKLQSWEAVGPTGFPDPMTRPGSYEVGEPFTVMYQLWPLVFVCKLCGKA